jgi:putative transposase
MQRMGLVSIAPKPHPSAPAKTHKTYPYLLGTRQINRPDQVWCSDITYLPSARGFVYLTAVMDWYSRYVLSWEVSVTLEEHFCVSALESALRRHSVPEIFNTDQGSQYTGKAFPGTLQQHGIQISRDGKGRATDNVMIERLWRSVKYEEVYVKDYQNGGELIQALKIIFPVLQHKGGWHVLAVA